MRSIFLKLLSQFSLRAAVVFIAVFASSCYREICMPNDVSGVYFGRFQSIEEVMELSHDDTYLHKVFFGATCLLEEKGCYSVSDGSITFNGFSQFIDFDVLLKGVCRTNGLKYVFKTMIYVPESRDGGGKIKPDCNFDFCYVRVSTNEWLTKTGIGIGDVSKQADK